MNAVAKEPFRLLPLTSTPLQLNALSADDISVVSGHSSPAKLVAIAGTDDETIKKAFS